MLSLTESAMGVTIDLSLRRFSPLWLLVGALIGRAAGLILGMNIDFWYFTDARALWFWQIALTILGALFYSFLMTSDSDTRLKGSLLGLGAGFGIAAYGGELWASLQHRTPPGLKGITVAEGIIYEWLMMHGAWLGVLVGWIIGSAVRRKNIANPLQLTASPAFGGDSDTSPPLGGDSGGASVG
jgi:hypothetical protein